MYYDDQQDGVGLDLTPFVKAAESGASSYAKIAEAEAKRKAAKQAPAPTIINQSGAPMRRTNPLTYVALAAAAIGVFLLGRRMMKRRR